MHRASYCAFWHFFFCWDRRGCSHDWYDHWLKVWNATVLNFTRADFRRIDLELSVPHNTNLQYVEQLLHSVVDGDSRVQHEPEPNSRFGDESESAIRLWVRTTDYDNAPTALKREIAEGLGESGIHMPYTRLQLTVNSSADADITHSV